MEFEKISSIICNNNMGDEEEEHTTDQLRKGQWTPEEDSKLSSAIAIHGDGRWTTLALLAGLRRSGKSCRLRWLNYLRPDLKHGSFTLEEQLHILQLHLQWGNRWSKIAEYLPGRTDNEIKNYWRTKVQKLARQFNCHVNSPEFKDALRHTWIPRLVEQIQVGSNATPNSAIEAQTEGPSYEDGLGLVDFYYINGPRDFCLFGTPSTSWAQTSMGQTVNGSEALFSKPTNLPGFCEAQISPEYGLSSEWKMTLNYGDNMFLQQQMDYL